METVERMRTTSPDLSTSSRLRYVGKTLLKCSMVLSVHRHLYQVRMGLNAEEVMIEMVEDNR